MGGGAGKLVMGRKRLAWGFEEIRWPQQSFRLPAKPVLMSLAGRTTSAQRYAPVGPVVCDLADQFRLNKNDCKGSEEMFLAPVLHFQGLALATLSLSLCIPFEHLLFLDLFLCDTSGEGTLV